MDGADVVTLALRTALGLPGASHGFPFGPDWDVVKVANKVFLLATEVPGAPVVTLKCDPEEALSLQQEHPGITPGYHMNKRHWLTLHGGPAVTPALVEELVEGSYALVVAGLPRHRRPPLRHVPRPGGDPLGAQESRGRGIVTTMTTTPSTSADDQPIARPTGLHHVRLSVSDIERSRAFYTHLLGSEPAIDKTSELSDPTAVDDPQRLYGGVVFELGDQVLGLRPVPGAVGDRFSPTRVGLDHLSLAVSSRADLDAASARLSAAGVEHGEVVELPDQDIQILSVQDPDAINLELTAPLSA